jgi:hypothetical protein
LDITLAECLKQLLEFAQMAFLRTYLFYKTAMMWLQCAAKPHEMGATKTTAFKVVLIATF